MTTPNYREIDVPDQIIRDIREYYGDHPEFNRLIEGVEVSDSKIKLAVQLYIHNFNNEPPKLAQKYGADNFPSAMVLFQGVVIQLLSMTGIIKTRNFLNFRDGSASFEINDQGQKYEGWINTLMQQHREKARSIKVAKNAEEGFDFIGSPDGWAPYFN